MKIYRVLIQREDIISLDVQAETAEEAKLQVENRSDLESMKPAYCDGIIIIDVKPEE